MTLHRLKLQPRSPWRTPWQADTLMGALCATCARTHGLDSLRNRLIEPMLAGEPPFVLSDALPGSLLPAPITLRLRDWPPEKRKFVKRARWLEPDQFERARRDQSLSADHLIRDEDVFLDHGRQHNTLDRLTDSTGDSETGLGIFNRPESMLLTPNQTHSSDIAAQTETNAPDHLSVYIRLLHDQAADLLLDLFQELSLTGFGADVATGRGRFDLPDNPQPTPGLEQQFPEANGVITLSTFQPGPNDTVNGFWDPFPKFGKLGPGLGLKNDEVKKKTLILFRPGACFQTDPRTPYLGHAVAQKNLLPHPVAAKLAQRDINVIHPAFALTLPLTINTSYDS